MLLQESLIHTFPYLTPFDFDHLLGLIGIEHSDLAIKKTKKITLSLKNLKEASKIYSLTTGISFLPPHFYFYESIRQNLTQSPYSYYSSIFHRVGASSTPFKPFPILVIDHWKTFSPSKKIITQKKEDLSLSREKKPLSLTFQECLDSLGKPIEKITLPEDLALIFHLAPTNPEFCQQVIEHLNKTYLEVCCSDEIEENKCFLDEWFFERASSELDWAKMKIDRTLKNATLQTAYLTEDAIDLHEKKVCEIFERLKSYPIHKNPEFFKKLRKHVAIVKNPSLQTSFLTTFSDFFDEEPIEDIELIIHSNFSIETKKNLLKKIRKYPSLETILTLFKEKSIEEAKILIKMIPHDAFKEPFTTLSLLQIVKKLVFYKEKEMAKLLLEKHLFPGEIVDLLESTFPAKEELLTRVQALSKEKIEELLSALEKTLCSIQPMALYELAEELFSKIPEEEETPIDDFQNRFRARMAVKFAISQEIEKSREVIQKITDHRLKFITYLRTCGAFFLIYQSHLEIFLQDLEKILQSDLLDDFSTRINLNEENLKKDLIKTIEETSHNEPTIHPLNSFKNELYALKNSSLINLIAIALITHYPHSKDAIFPWIATLGPRFLTLCGKEKQDALKNLFLILISQEFSTFWEEKDENPEDLLHRSQDFRLSYQAVHLIEEPFLQKILKKMIDHKFSANFPEADNPF